MALLGATAAPPSLISHLTKIRDWSPKRHFKYLHPRASRRSNSPLSATTTSRSLWTGNGKNGDDRIPYHRHLWDDLRDYKNGRNLSVIDYLNIESKWSPFHSPSDVKTTSGKVSNGFLIDQPNAHPNHQRRPFLDYDRWPSSSMKDDAMEKSFSSLDPKPFSVDSLLYPFKDKTTIGDVFVLELFEKDIMMTDKHTSKLPMLVLSHPKLFNGLVMNPIDRVFPSCVPPGASTTKNTSPATIKLHDDVAHDLADIAPASDDSPSTTSSKVPSVETRRRVGVIRRLSPKEILQWIRASNPHLQRTVDEFKYDILEPSEAEASSTSSKSRTRMAHPLHPVLETRVAALLPSSQRGGNAHFVLEGNDCVSVFDETNFFSDEYHCQSADSGVANWGVDGELRIFDVESVDGFVLHFGFVDRGTLSVGDRIHLKIDDDKRSSISANHTAAHLLNFSFDEIFSTSSEEDRLSRAVRVRPHSLEMEFQTNQKEDVLGEAQIGQMERLVNLMIYHKVPVHREKITVEQAKSLNISLAPPIDPVIPTTNSYNPDGDCNKDESDNDLKFRFEFDSCEPLTTSSSVALTNMSDIFTSCWSTSEAGNNSKPSTSLIPMFDSNDNEENPTSRAASVEGVTVVSVGIPASDLVNAIAGSGNASPIGACSLEACSGTHVTDTSQIHSFVVTDVEKMAEGRSRITAVSKNEADSVLRNADMLSSHLDALEAQSASLNDRLPSVRQFGDTLDAVSRNVASSPLPATARTDFLRRLETLNLIRASKEAEFFDAATHGGVTSRKAAATPQAQRWAPPPTTLVDDVSRQLVEEILRLGVDSSDTSNGANSASEWMKKTLQSVLGNEEEGAAFTSGAVNRELSEDRFSFAAVKLCKTERKASFPFTGEESSLEEARLRQRRLSDLSLKIEAEARKIIQGSPDAER